MAQDPNIYDNLTASIAPSIWEMDDVKRGILCQLFGGTSKVAAVSSKSVRCSRMHCLPHVYAGGSVRVPGAGTHRWAS